MSHRRNTVDVVELIAVNHWGRDFARHLPKSLRKEFCELVLRAGGNAVRIMAGPRRSRSHARPRLRFSPNPDYSRLCRPKLATYDPAGTSIAAMTATGSQTVGRQSCQLRRSGNGVRDLVPAYVNNPD